MELNKLLKRKQRAIDEGNKLQEAEICNKLATYYYSHNKLHNALLEYKREAKLYEELNMKMDCGKANRMLAEVYMLQGDYIEALKYEDVYMKTAKDENNSVELQRAYTTLGRIYLLKGQECNNESGKKLFKDSKNDLVLAEKAFLKSLIISKDLSKDVSKFQIADMQARVYLNLGVTKEEIKSFDQAIDYYKTALKICKINDLYELEHKCLMCLGLCYTTKFNDTLNAMQNFNNAVEVAKRIDSKNEKICETLIAKSELLIKSGDYHSAKKVLKKAFRMKTSIENDMDQIQKNLKIVHALCKYEDELIITDSFDYENRKRLFEKLGDGSCKLKVFPKAIEFYLKQLEAAELNGETGKKLIPIYISLYQTYIDMGQYDDAMKFLELEYELIKENPKEACITLLSMGNLSHKAMKNFWDVDAVYRKALCDARKAEDLQTERTIIKKIVELCKENKMESLSEILEQEAEAKGIDLKNDIEDFEMSEDLLDSCGINALDIELSTDMDSSENEEVEKLATKTTVRKKRSIAVKKNAKGETKLHGACIEGNYHLAKMLLDQGHPVNLRDNAGWLCIHEAANHGHRDIVELLLDHGGQSTINDKGGVNCEGITPLFDACSNGHLTVVELLLNRGAKATIKNDYNQTPLQALMIWYESSCKKLTVTEKEMYEQIKERLVDQCEKVGLHVDKSFKSSSAVSPTESKSSQSSSRMRNNMRINPSLDDITDSDYDRMNRSDENNEDRIKKLARQEYKNAMQKLKHPHKESKYPHYENEHESRKRSAYLDAQEIQVDDWLEDDLGPSKKKRKGKFGELTAKTLRESNSANQLPRKISQGSSSNSISSDSDTEKNCNIFTSSLKTNASEIDTADPFELLINTSNENIDKFRTRRNSNTKLQRNSSNLSSLYDEELNRLVDFDDSSLRASNTSAQNSSLSESLNKRNLFDEKKTIIKVQIEDEKIIVPINKRAADDLKISWLIEESARRYYCLKGIRPEIKLKTADGATLMDTDSLSLILCLTEENLIYSEILDWKLPSVSNRYIEACSEYKCPIDNDINELLNMNRTSTNINLSNLNLNPINVFPIFKAFQHQHCLSYLDLSNNFIQDDGIKSLTPIIATLKNLSHLNLSGNGITENGIKFFCTTLEKSATPAELKQLNLSFNPITSTSLKYVSSFCRVKSIRSLHLSSCGLTKFGRDEASFGCLKELDISYNHFERNGLENLAKSINGECMEVLNLNRCTSESNIDEIISHFIASMNHETLKVMKLSGLKLSERQILDVLRSMQSCKALNSLDLSYQKEVTFSAIKFLLFNMENLNHLNINLLGCQKLQESFDRVHRNEQKMSLHSCHLQMSLAKKVMMNDVDEYLMKLRDFWAGLTENKGIVKQECNILHMIAEA